MNNQLDSFAERKFFQYYQLNSIPETMLLSEIEDSVTSAKATAKPKNSERNVIFGLGIISILLLISGLQLQRSVNRIPATTKTIQTNRELDASSNTKTILRSLLPKTYSSKYAVQLSLFPKQFLSQ